MSVATVPTVYGIETLQHSFCIVPRYDMLQQYLPFTELKHADSLFRLAGRRCIRWLQQHLPFTVLKLF